MVTETEIRESVTPPGWFLGTTVEARGVLIPLLIFHPPRV
jgi:hypothetical protein